MIAGIILLLLILFVIIFLISRIKIVPQAQEYVIERLGSYSTTWTTGLHLLVPFVDRIAKKVSLKEVVVDFRPQPVITKDNVTMQIDSVVFYQVTDPKLYTYGVERPLIAIENLTATTLRNIIGELELDATLTSRDHINSQITSILDQATDRWGIKINRVELKNILPPAEIQDAMEKQMKAERERRETMLRAEGEKRSSVLVAEGKKQAQILSAEAEKEAKILRAEAEKQAMILHADAVREQKIRSKTFWRSRASKRLPKQRTARQPNSSFRAKFKALQGSRQVPANCSRQPNRKLRKTNRYNKRKGVPYGMPFLFAPMGLGGHRMEHENVTRDRGRLV